MHPPIISACFIDTTLYLIIFTTKNFKPHIDNGKGSVNGLFCHVGGIKNMSTLYLYTV